MLVTIFPLIPVNNWLMSMVKLGSQKAITTTWLRLALVLFSFLGVLATSALFGTEPDFNKISELVGLLVEVLGLSALSHFSYKLIKHA